MSETPGCNQQFISKPCPLNSQCRYNFKIKQTKQTNKTACNWTQGS